MRVYVAGKFEETVAVRAVMNAFRQRGHEVTYDWTVTPPCACGTCLAARRSGTSVVCQLYRATACLGCRVAFPNVPI